LTGEVAGLREQLKGKETDIGHLMEECRQYKEEMGLLYDEIKEHGEIHSEQIAEIIKVKFQSENILELYNALRARLGNMEGVIVQLKAHLGQVLAGHRGIAQ
jgi:predicted  nucleic acid-binding Zn-ribbon protein